MRTTLLDVGNEEHRLGGMIVNGFKDSGFHLLVVGDQGYL